MTKSTVETEVKIRVDNAVATAIQLQQAGYRISHHRALEKNVLFDTAERTFRGRKQVIRLREFAGTVTFCYKGTAIEGLHKTREELEVTVSDFDRAAVMLGRMGFRASFTYEKFRTEFQKPGDVGTIMLDETIVGDFLELEGPDEWIDETAARLGFDQAQYLNASYGRLYVEWCQQKNIECTDMIFPR
jgi:adenylate cyclase, class 2